MILLHGSLLNPWIGYTDQEVEGVWQWSDESNNNSLTLWAGNQPDDWKNNEDCAHLRSDVLLNDAPCSTTYNYVCKISCKMCCS